MNSVNDIDFSAFETIPRKQDIKAYIAAHPGQSTAPKKRSAARFVVPATVLIVVAIGFVTETQANGLFLSALWTIALVIVFGFMFIAVRSVNRAILWRAWSLATQLDQFAQDNSFQHIHNQPVQALGLMTIDTKDATYTKINAIVTPRFEIGQVFADDGVRGRGSQGRQFTYIRIPLATSLPNMLLATKAKTTPFGDESHYYDKADRVELEGDFDKYFTLFVANGDQELARYFFTPDLMALFIDNDQGHDAEIINDALYIYLNDSASTMAIDWSDRALWGKATELYDTVGTKIEHEAVQYKNADVASDGTASAAQPYAHLMRRTPLIIKVLPVVLAMLYAVSGVAQLVSSSNSQSMVVSTTPKLTQSQITNALSVAGVWLSALAGHHFSDAVALEDPDFSQTYDEQQQEAILPTTITNDTTFMQVSDTAGVPTSQNLTQVVSVVFVSDTTDQSYIRVNLVYREGDWRVFGIQTSPNQLYPDINTT